MNKKIVLASVVALSMAIAAYATDNTVTSSEKNAASAAVDMNKVSYAIGYMVGADFKKQDIAVSPEQFSAGFSAALTQSKPEISQEEMRQVLRSFEAEIRQKALTAQQKIATDNLAKANAFLADVAKSRDVKKIEDGLYYKVSTQGKGAIPAATDSVEVNYEGSTIDSKVFDSSYKRGKVVSFALSQVIPGWSKALQKMPVGSTWTLYIAPNLAYGEYAPPQIGPNQALVFKIELLKILPADPKSPSLEKLTTLSSNS